jgi:hypothetical protein
MPEEFLKRVNEVPSAKETFEGLNKGNRWKIYFTLVALRTDKGKDKAIERFVDMLARGETPVPQKPKTTATNEKTATISESRAPRKKRRDPTPDEAGEDREENTSKRRTRSGRAAPSYAE